MIDRLFTLILTLFVLIGGTIAVGAEWFGNDQDRATEARIATLPRVTVTGKRLPIQTEIASTVSTPNTSEAIRFVQ